MTREFIENKIQNDDRWLERGILAIWKYQTQSEKVQVNTHLFNGVGFNGPDGHFMTSLGNILNKGYHLSDKQKFVARKKMAKYCGQLLKIANEKTIEDIYREEAKKADAWLIKQFEEGKVKFVGGDNE